ncbi:MAG: hypothetical protein E7013_02510 [Alphaproteobacteria bacterium]|nr:hypothetical protein [Alphaproteobacteria bacterium]
MYEDRTVEARYLINFSPLEILWFMHDQRRKREYPKAFKNYFLYLLKNDKKTPIFEMANPTTALEIKYVLNRISRNDYRDTSFDLICSDNVINGDEIANKLAQALKNNTFCTNIQLEIGLSDEGVKPLLEVLQHKKLHLLNLKANNFTEKTYSLLEQIIFDPKNNWDLIYLNPPLLKDKSFTHLEQSPKVKVEKPYFPQNTKRSILKALAKYSFVSDVLRFERNRQRG